MGQRLINLREVQHKTSLSKTRIYDLISRGEFPRPVKLSDKPGARSAWLESSIDNWIQARAAASADYGDAA